MRAISVKQPWAYLLVAGIKDVENRRWSTGHRGPLVIHASKTWDKDGYEYISDRLDEYVPSKNLLPRGALVGLVELVDCTDVYASKWFTGPWGWVVTKAIEFKKPIQYRGQLGTFCVSNRLIPNVRR